MNNIETNLSAFLSDSISNDSNSESIIIFSSSENAGYPVITHLGISYSGNKYPLSYAGYVTVDVDMYSIIQPSFSFQITQLDSNGSPITTTYYLNQNGILNIQDVIITELSLNGICPEPNKLRIQYEWKSQDLESGNPEPGDPSNPNNPNNPSNPSPKERARELGPPSHYDGDTLQFIYRYEINPEDLETYGFASIMSGRIYGKLTNNIFTPDDFKGYFLAVFNQNVKSDDIADYWTWTFIPTQ